MQQINFIFDLNYINFNQYQHIKSNYFLFILQVYNMLGKLIWKNDMK